MESGPRSITKSSSADNKRRREHVYENPKSPIFNVTAGVFTIPRPLMKFEHDVGLHSPYSDVGASQAIPAFTYDLGGTGGVRFPRNSGHGLCG